jgi:hypothetical protein
LRAHSFFTIKEWLHQQAARLTVRAPTAFQKYFKHSTDAGPWWTGSKGFFGMML